MTAEHILGVAIIAAGLTFISFITFRSRNIIRRIAKKREGTVREIMQDAGNE